MKFDIQQVNDKEKWGELLLISNGEIELQIPLTIGPRITSFRFIDGENIFYEAPDAKKHFGSNEWFPYGGHRLWHAPEQNPRSYYPDNQPVKIEETENTLAVIQDPEETTGIQKTIRIHLDTNGNNIRIDHVLKNNGLWELEFAGWALSMLGKNGKAIIPLPEKIPFPKALLPNHALIIWPYTDLSDPRLIPSKEFLTISQIPEELPFKIGVMCEKNWIGYFKDTNFFVKKFQFVKNRDYPDFGSCVEIFTNGEMLELETISPLQKIKHGEELIHREDWELWRTDSVPANEMEIDSVIQKYLI